MFVAPDVLLLVEKPGSIFLVGFSIAKQVATD
jgi:hypothetical protein